MTFFLGGWHGPGPGWLDPIWVIVKIFGFLFCSCGSAPRCPVRYDQLMSLGWKVLLPLATLNVLVTAVLVAVDVSAGSTPAGVSVPAGREVVAVQRGPEPGGAGASTAPSARRCAA